MEKQYIAIDLKSFYASAECVSRGLDPLDACLVVADLTRTDKTICLAVTPALKALGIPGRPRLFEVRQKLREVNLDRARRGIICFRFGNHILTFWETCISLRVSKLFQHIWNQFQKHDIWQFSVSGYNGFKMSADHAQSFKSF